MATTTMECRITAHPELTFRYTLLRALNPETVDHILYVHSHFGLKCPLGHVVISGQNFWMPTRSSMMGAENKVVRTPGSVYLYSPGGSMCFCYGSVTESAKVNKFGEVAPDDLPKLAALGGLVWQNTIAQFSRTPVVMEVVPVD